MSICRSKQSCQSARTLPPADGQCFLIAESLFGYAEGLAVIYDYDVQRRFESGLIDLMRRAQLFSEDPRGVKITDGGWIIANNTDRASFGGNAKVLADGTVRESPHRIRTDRRISGAEGRPTGRSVVAYSLCNIYGPAALRIGGESIVQWQS